jgi:hypothetical protein
VLGAAFERHRGCAEHSCFVPVEVELLFPRRRAAAASPVAISPPALATARWGLFRVPLAEDRKLKALPEDNGFRLWLAVLGQQF